MKKLISLLLTAALCSLTFSGCQSGKTESSGAGSNASAAPKDKVVEIKLAHVIAETTAAHKATVRLAELAAEKSGGTLSITLFPNASLGNESDIVENINNGAIQMGYISSGAIGGSFYPDFQVVDMPYIFKDMDAAHSAARGDIMKKMYGDMESRTNIKVLDAWIKAPRDLYTKKPVNTPDDLTGMKIRTPDIPLYFETFTALGASVTPIAFSETYSSLMQGVVVGTESSLDIAYGAKFQEVTDYVSLIQWNISLSGILINKNFFASLSPDQQTALVEAAIEAGDQNLEDTKKVDEEYVALYEEAGNTVIEPDLDAFREKAAAAIPKLKETLETPELYDQLFEKYGN